MYYSSFGTDFHLIGWNGNKQTNKQTISNPCSRYKRQMKFLSLSFQQHSTLFTVHALLHVCFFIFLFQSIAFDALISSAPTRLPSLHSLICNFKMFFLAICSAWIYCFATSSAFFAFIISASFAFIFLIFRLLLLLLSLLFFFCNFNQQRNVILLTLYNSMLLSDVIVSFHQLKMPSLSLCVYWLHFFFILLISFKRFFIRFHRISEEKRENINEHTMKMYWYGIDADTRDFQFWNLHFKWNIGKPFKYADIHTHPHAHIAWLISDGMQRCSCRNVVKLLFNGVVYRPFYVHVYVSLFVVSSPLDVMFVSS